MLNENWSIRIKISVHGVGTTVHSTCLLQWKTSKLPNHATLLSLSPVPARLYFPFQLSLCFFFFSPFPFSPLNSFTQFQAAEQLGEPHLKNPFQRCIHLGSEPTLCSPSPPPFSPSFVLSLPFPIPSTPLHPLHKFRSPFFFFFFFSPHLSGFSFPSPFRSVDSFFLNFHTHLVIWFGFLVFVS